MHAGSAVRSNHWTEHASSLATAYVRDAGTIRFELVTRAILALLGDFPQRIVDVGGGYGLQAVMLARAGHVVTIVDLDPRMLDLAKRLAAQQPSEVRSRISCILGDGQSATNTAGSGFDFACCHSVLLYEDDPTALLHELVALTRPGGFLSVVSLNPQANAMRSGLQGRWSAAVATLQAGVQMDDRYLEYREHTRERVGEILESAGARVIGWHGIGVFTDHLAETIRTENPAEVILAEWLAGSRDPYRQVARCYHLLAQRLDDVQGRDSSRC
jgi:S-adenosylmethionine-dependent methyltransferase